MGLLGTISWIIELNQTVFSAAGQDFTWCDFIPIAGRQFPVCRAMKEIRPGDNLGSSDILFETCRPVSTFGMLSQIPLLGLVFVYLVFSIESILTAIRLTDHVVILVIAVAPVLLAANLLANFVQANPRSSGWP